MDSDSPNRQPSSFDFSYIPEFPKDGATKTTYENMRKAIEIYQSNPDKTLRLEITEQAFNRLKDRPGMKGPGFSHIREVGAQNEVRYYLVVSPYTNLVNMRRLGNTGQKALTLSANYFSIQDDNETINFQLAEITAGGVSDVDDRSEVYPKDILKIDFISSKDAEALTIL